MINIVDIFKAALLIGVPLFAFTYAIHWWALKKGHITPFNHHSEVEQELEENGDSKPGWLMENWVTFGGGFYGTMAFFTYLFIELGQLYEVVGKLLSNGFSIEYLIKLAVEEFVDAILNLVNAFIWFNYWPDVFDMEFPLGWLLVAYGAYWLAVQAVRGRFATSS
ncbi:hypothetical protein [Kordiimonas laminariae]|uniref:hypothetical protein n=1 Tax=Kordiimonas laminariae TaxID=2917717 RepID=UPI001FF25521|nr:hypothetical protein [Kordiimonas laminariae]MCK0068085.1 hypothetical protein [Kordiimonas laminariae]